jgi:hypothetical protein
MYTPTFRRPSFVTCSATADAGSPCRQESCAGRPHGLRQVHLDKAIEAGSDVPFEAREIVETVREALREEVHDAVANAMRELMTEVAESTAVITPSAERDVKKKVA